MLIGSYLGILSDARRVAVPKKFLIELGENPVLAKWYEDCLILVSSDFWDKLSVRLTGDKKAFDLGVRDIERFILGSAFEVEPDEQGRIIIPEILFNYAKLEKETIFVGLIDRVEVWPKSVWDEKSESLAKTTKEYLENLAKNEKR
ncbi:MAG: Protein MraZ [Candidatus Woesebacteria bacterium GW2011_GWC2_45_9]|uniref:Transcriptional regulator MraZ n=2 Tax=Microgenomates group TaxID=1794810 RepID=A0A0G1QHE5_9BACT|nr:MAG: Protein MraZ [Candidatus Curtissbacteria bacterium GW2011_GWC1_44_33]KKU17143.1 MAG: Protein MraZ [Candidatus Woesebacteria bacterium GW2011_GWC2_45_9]